MISVKLVHKSEAAGGVVSRRVVLVLAAAVLIPSLPVYCGSACAEDQDSSPAGFSYSDYAAALSSFVDARGMVDYCGLKADDGRLRAFTDSVARLDPGVFAAWSEQDKIAFWLNAYNGFTLKTITANYPIKSSFAASLRFPKNSIRQIKGVWDKLTFPVMGDKMTLEKIEHGTLRVQFNEPRIHMALVCAAIGCPPLRNEPYVGARLADQLDDQTRRFLRNPTKFRIDRAGERVYISPIFEWFGKDFVKTYGTDKGFAGHSADERAVLNYISNYVGENDRRFLTTAKYRITYLDYNWSLNEQ